MGDMAKGYIKDPNQRAEQLPIVKGWQEDCEQLDAPLGRPEKVQHEVKK